ncbi:DUF1616 domain-containing protein [Thermogladius sp. KZ2Tp1]|uniref:DUF1616 domain-containing protein n=1 Tax=Thermogladius sp. KZ2Tp1 TaxID=3136289 RepID=UPI003DA7A9ED
MILDDEVFAVVLAISVVLSVVGIAVSLPRPSENFAAIGLLNKEGKIGDYPSNVRVGQVVSLNVFVYNHLGYTALFRVDVKVGDGEVPSNTTPLPKPPLFSLYTLLGDYENATIPFNVTFTYPMVNQTLVLELYDYSPDNSTWVYMGEYVFLRLNVTGVVL